MVISLGAYDTVPDFERNHRACNYQGYKLEKRGINSTTFPILCSRFSPISGIYLLNRNGSPDSFNLQDMHTDLQHPDLRCGVILEEVAQDMNLIANQRLAQKLPPEITLPENISLYHSNEAEIIGPFNMIWKPGFNPVLSNKPKINYASPTSQFSSPALSGALGVFRGLLRHLVP